MGQGFSYELAEESLGERVRDQLGEVLQLLRSNDPGLAAVEVPNCGIGDDGLDHGARALSANEHIQEVDVGYNGITTVGCTILAEQLQKSPCGNDTLLTLRLSGNAIGNAGVKALCQWLSSNPPLENLFLYNCSLTDEAVLHIANALQKNTSLVSLNIDANAITNRSIIMLNKAMENNETLTRLDLPAPPPNIKFSDEILAQLHEKVNQNNQLRAAKIQQEENRRTKAANREKAAAEEKAKQDAIIAVERAKVDAEIAELEKMKEAEDAEVRRLQSEVDEKLRLQAAAADRKRALRDAEIEKRRLESEKWRLKLTANGTLVKEWRSGFTVLKMAPGQVGGVPTDSGEPDRRLKPCWCDPQDATTPYAKTLHYHCRYENAEGKTVDDSGSGVPKYEGCRCTGHRCATVGFAAEPLPDTSAAHFFASAHPSSTM